MQENNNLNHNNHVASENNLQQPNLSEQVVPTQNVTNLQQSVQIQTPSEPNNKGNKKRTLLLVIGVVVIIVLIIIVVLTKKEKNTELNNNDTNINQNINNNDDTDLNQKEENNDNNTDKDYDENIQPLDRYKEEYDKNGDFLFRIEDIFQISGKGTVVTGRVERGSVRLNDTVELIGYGEKKNVTVVGIEQYRTVLDYSEYGENIGIILQGVTKDEIVKGQVLSKTGSMSQYKKFEAEIYVLSKVEGGRSENINNGDGFDIKYRMIDKPEAFGKIYELSNNKINTGTVSNVRIELDNFIPMEVGTVFSGLENGRITFVGKVTKLLEGK